MNDIFAQIERKQIQSPAGCLLNYARYHNVMDMHYGALPEAVLKTLFAEDLLPKVLSASVNQYAAPRGDRELRELICNQYFQKYQVIIDPDTEILLTNGSTEAIALSILLVSDVGSRVAVTDPAYPMFARSITNLGRHSISLNRQAGKNEYLQIDWHKLRDAAALIVNSPENPTGYVLSKADWLILEEMLNWYDTYLIHDELLGLLDYDGGHKPAISMSALRDRTLLVGGLSKVFAAPGLRLGWLIAPPKLIKKAYDLQCSFSQGVSPVLESASKMLFKSPQLYETLVNIVDDLRVRRSFIMSSLNERRGYQWTRLMQGGLTTVVEVSNIFRQMPLRYQSTEQAVGTCVARYFFDTVGVSVLPGVMYGSLLSNYIKVAICGEQSRFHECVDRLGSL